jgi:hypothetical protein
MHSCPGLSARIFPANLVPVLDVILACFCFGNLLQCLAFFTEDYQVIISVQNKQNQNHISTITKV